MNENISNGQINRIPIIMGAYTGKAAYHIKGYTLHTLFRLPTKLKGAMPRLKDDDIEKLNRIFNDTVLLIIDEELTEQHFECFGPNSKAGNLAKL